MRYHRCFACLGCLKKLRFEHEDAMIGLIGLGRCVLCGESFPREQLAFVPMEKLVEAGVPASAFEGIDLE